jgi:hypothetical protein
MAVAYETGVATSPSDLLSKLRSFAEDNDWATSSTSTPPLPGGAVFEYNDSGVDIFGAVGLGPTYDIPPALVLPTVNWLSRGCRARSGGAAFNAQTSDSGIEMEMNLGAGPYTAYHFYAGKEDASPYLHMTVEVAAGKFRHWALGRVVPYGVLNTGCYIDSTYVTDQDNYRNQPDASVHRMLCDSVYSGDTTSGHFHLNYDGSSAPHWNPVSFDGATVAPHKGLGTIRSNGLIQGLMEVGQQAYNLRTPLWPLEYFANRASQTRSAIGRMPNLRAINMRAYANGELLTIGGEEWQVFPLWTRSATFNPANPAGSSWLYGYAHRR